tara:strand:- start:392 stop:586 length:195 start_codon:yes stop_codon:yes gene_type:complete
MITINFTAIKIGLEVLFSILGIAAFIYIILIGYKLNRLFKRMDMITSFKCLAGVLKVFSKKNAD